MNYKNIDEIVAEFGLSGVTFDEIRRELIKIQASLHPDLNSGEFETEESKELFFRLDSAIEYIDKFDKNKSLVPINDLTAIIEAIKDIIPTSQPPSLDNQLSANIDRYIDVFRKRQLFPKISSTSITAVLSALWLFPDTILNHPVLSSLIPITTPDFLLIWSLSISITLFVWIISRNREIKEKKFADRLKTEQYQNILFEKYLNREVMRNKTDQNHLHLFSRKDFIEYLLDFRYFGERYVSNIFDRMNQIIVSRPSIDYAIVENLVDSILHRALNHKVIEEDNRYSSMTKRYLFDSNKYNPYID